MLQLRGCRAIASFETARDRRNLKLPVIVVDCIRSGGEMGNQKQQKWQGAIVGRWSWTRVLRLIVLAYLSLAAYAAFLSDRSIFLPQPASYRDSDEILKIPVRDGIRISARYLPNPKADLTVLYSHGNAEDLGRAAGKLERLQQLGFAVFAYEYQGYGTSDGKASARNAIQDINAAYRYLTQELNVPPEKIIAYGFSVGGGPAVDLAAREAIGGLVVNSSFVSTFRVVTQDSNSAVR